MRGEGHAKTTMAGRQDVCPASGPRKAAYRGGIRRWAEGDCPLPVRHYMRHQFRHRFRDSAGVHAYRCDLHSCGESGCLSEVFVNSAIIQRAGLHQRAQQKHQGNLLFCVGHAPAGAVHRRSHVGRTRRDINQNGVYLPATCADTRQVRMQCRPPP